ncbi:MAG: YtzH-like family protein [Ectobacillus sp.]
MPLSHEHQIAVLKDILTNHQCDCCGTVSECEQMERLIKSLMENDSINADMKTMLNDVYYYSQTGKYSSDLDQHINNHQEQLSQWISGIDSFS